MAVFSRITTGVILACVATSSLLVQPVAADKALAVHGPNKVGRRAAHNAVGQARSSKSAKKRASNKKDYCAAKAAASASSSSSAAAAAKTSSAPPAAAPAETSQKANKNPAPAGPAPSGGKAGLAWNDGVQEYQEQFFTTGKVTWAYSWSAWTPCYNPSHCEFVPQFWGPDKKDEWTQQILNGGQTYANHLFYNEPDQPGQSSVDPGTAANDWWYFTKVPGRHGGPAVTNGPSGLAWLEKFMAAGPNPDFVCLHFYGTDAQSLKDVVTQVCNQYGKPLWLTEWADNDYSGQGQYPSQSQVNAFLADTQSWLDNNACVERYAYFGALTKLPTDGFDQNNRLMDSGGGITDLGRQYIAW